MSNFSRHRWNAFNQWVLKLDVTISCLYSVFLQCDTITLMSIAFINHCIIKLYNSMVVIMIDLFY